MFLKISRTKISCLLLFYLSDVGQYANNWPCEENISADTQNTPFLD